MSALLRSGGVRAVLAVAEAVGVAQGLRFDGEAVHMTLRLAAGADAVGVDAVRVRAVLRRSRGRVGRVHYASRSSSELCMAATPPWRARPSPARGETGIVTARLPANCTVMTRSSAAAQRAPVFSPGSFVRPASRSDSADWVVPIASATSICVRLRL